jgi:hypothetical protein
MSARLGVAAVLVGGYDAAAAAASVPDVLVNGKERLI